MFCGVGDEVADGELFEGRGGGGVILRVALPAERF